jgi:hypothetical protein
MKGVFAVLTAMGVLWFSLLGVGALVMAAQESGNGTVSVSPVMIERFAGRPLEELSDGEVRVLYIHLAPEAMQDDDQQRLLYGEPVTAEEYRARLGAMLKDAATSSPGAS